MLSCSGRPDRGACGGATPRFVTPEPTPSRSVDWADGILTRLKACEEAHSPLQDAIGKTMAVMEERFEDVEKRLQKLEMTTGGSGGPSLANNSQVNVQVQVAGNNAAETPMGASYARVDTEAPMQVKAALIDLKKHAEHQVELQGQLKDLQAEMDHQVNLSEEIRTLTKSLVFPVGWENDIKKMQDTLKQNKTDDLDQKSIQRRQFAEVENCVQWFVDSMQNIQKGGNAVAKPSEFALEEARAMDDGDNPTVSKFPIDIEPNPEDAGDGVLAMPEHVVHEFIEYTIGDSTWEIACLMFEGVLGRAKSIQILIMLFSTILCQACFTAVCYLQFTETTFNEDLEDQYTAFRLNIAHDNRYTDTIDQKSFAQRLCERSLSLELGAQQLGTLQNIDSYKGAEGDGILNKMFAGPLMCCLALTCWAMTVLVELRGILDFMKAIMRLPIAPESVVLYRSERFSIESMSSCRRVTMFAILTIRLTLTCMLLYVGGFFLALEADVPNLLLNAVALEFVLHIDQLVFDCFATDLTKSFLEKLEPLKVPVSRTFCHIDVKSTLFCLLTSGYIFVFFIVVVSPMMQSMTRVRDALCEGYQAFAYVSDSFGFIYLGNMQSSGSIFMDMSKTTIRTAIDADEAVIDRPGVEKFGFALNPLKNGYSLSEMMSMGTDELINLYNPSCMDIFQSKRIFNYEAYVHQILDSSATSCADLAKSCNRADNFGIITRWICPLTCKCNTPMSLTRSMFARDGCPDACSKVPSYISVRNAAACEDWTVPNLATSQFWQQMLHYLDRRAATKDAKEALEKYGCEALRFDSTLTMTPTISVSAKYEYCTSTGNPALAVRPLAILCPVACQCNMSIGISQVSTMVRSCPGSCPEIDRWRTLGSKIGIIGIR